LGGIPATEGQLGSFLGEKPERCGYFAETGIEMVERDVLREVLAKESSIKTSIQDWRRGQFPSRKGGVGVWTSEWTKEP